MISVIGGSGFVGTRLCRRFQRAGDNFLIIDKAASAEFPEQAVMADVRDIDALRHTIDYGSIIVNLAAEHRDDVRPLSLYDEVNVLGAKNICAVAREKNVKKIIFTSSVAVYGFAELGTDEEGFINPFNDYGRTKYEAEQVFKAWQAESPADRSLIIIRPTVIFGERNRGNVYNLLRQIASGRFVMIGNGLNRKSMAYVENVAAFIQYGLNMQPGVHVYNYIDKPDFTMNSLVNQVNAMLAKGDVKFSLPFWVGYAGGLGFDLVSRLTGKRFPISAIRVKKFCANSVYNTRIDKTGFVAPVTMEEALSKTVRYEFIEDHSNESVFYTE